MRVQDLNIGELLHMDSEGGMIRFADHRMLLLDAGAMGLLRKYLVENFGLAATRTVLTQFGYAHGWRMADSIAGQFESDSDDDKRFAGTRTSTLLGLFRVAYRRAGRAVGGRRHAAGLLCTRSSSSRTAAWRAVTPPATWSPARTTSGEGTGRMTCASLHGRR